MRVLAVLGVLVLIEIAILEALRASTPFPSTLSDGTLALCWTPNAVWSSGEYRQKWCVKADAIFMLEKR